MIRTTKTLKSAISELQNGGLVAIPTETVYGLAAPVESLEQVKRIFEVKERPLFDPLIVHVANKSMAKRYAETWTDAAERLSEKFWPGPLTLVLKKSSIVNPLITAGLDTVGLRVPNHPLTLSLIQELDQGLAAPSANRFTKISPTQPSHIVDGFPESDFLVLDGGTCAVGIESTIVDVSGSEPVLLRPGNISQAQLEEVLGHKVSLGKTSLLSPNAPGQMEKHYVPPFPLVVLLRPVTEADTDLLRSKLDVNHVLLKPTIELNDDPWLASRTLYSKLRQRPPQDQSYRLVDLSNLAWDSRWMGIIDRLKKAATVFLD